MRIGPVLMVVAGVFACGHQLAAQALGEAVQINNQSLQGLGKPAKNTIMLSPGALQPGAPSPTGVDYGTLRTQVPVPDCGCAADPILSAGSGYVKDGTQVSIASPSPDAVIYYTTDGWTPTEFSTRYTGPITIHSDMRLQAIAEEPHKLPSTIVEADFSLTGSHPIRAPKVMAAGGSLTKGTVLHLATNADVTSDVAQPGDPIALRLDEYVMDGGAIAARRGDPAEGTITKVVPAGPNGKPGVITFQVQSLKVGGVTVPLRGILTLAAPDKAAPGQRIESTSQVHVARFIPHGDEAEIVPGMVLTAVVSADTQLHP
jgi:Chitobiase/beta-hexosaminidase C-terminal domain